MKSEKKSNREEFFINIYIDGETIVERQEHSLSYNNTAGYTDTLIIDTNLIVITGARTAKPNILEIFKNYKSGIYTQLVRSLSYYAIYTKSSFKIKKIEFCSVSDAEIGLLNESDIIQLFTTSNALPLLNGIDINKLIKIFDKGEDSNALLYAVTHLISSMGVGNNAYEAFEKLWKSFNALYKLVSKTNEDFKAQCRLRNFMIDNPSLFPLVTRSVSPLTASEIRDKVRWIAMLKNDYDTPKKTKAFK